MTVGELKQSLNKIPDNFLVIVEMHGYSGFYQEEADSVQPGIFTEKKSYIEHEFLGMQYDDISKCNSILIN